MSTYKKPKHPKGGHISILRNEQEKQSNRIALESVKRIEAELNAAGKLHTLSIDGMVIRTTFKKKDSPLYNYIKSEKVAYRVQNALAYSNKKLMLQ